MKMCITLKTKINTRYFEHLEMRHDTWSEAGKDFESQACCIVYHLE